MHWRTIAIILVLIVVYAVIGGVILHFIESSHENQIREIAAQKIKAFLDENPCVNLSTIRTISKLLYKAKRAGLQAFPGSTNLTYITNWDISSSIFLAFQIIGSVGYGNAPPQTVGGRIFSVFFAFIGIPLLLTAGLGIGYIMIMGAERLRKCCIRKAGPKDSAKIHLFRTLIIFVAIFIVFILFPAGIYTALDSNWNYGDAVYYCLVTVLTIGFGDYIPGSDWTTEARNAYRLSVGFWLIISLLAFSGLWNSVIIAIFSTKEMQEPLQDEPEEPVLNRIPSFAIKKRPDNEIPYVPPETTDYKIFASNSPPAVAFNSNPYVSSRPSPLYNVSIPQGNVTQISVR